MRNDAGKLDDQAMHLSASYFRSLLSDGGRHDNVSERTPPYPTSQQNSINGQYAGQHMWLMTTQHEAAVLSYADLSSR